MALSSSIELMVNVDSTKPTVTVDVIVNKNIPKEIFLYRQTLDRDLEGCYLSEFCAIVTPEQIEKYPADVPDAGNPFFRKSSVTLDFKDYGEITDFLNQLSDDVDLLIDLWDKKNLFSENQFILTFPSN